MKISWWHLLKFYFKLTRHTEPCCSSASFTLGLYFGFSLVFHLLNLRVNLESCCPIIIFSLYIHLFRFVLFQLIYRYYWLMKPSFTSVISRSIRGKTSWLSANPVFWHHPNDVLSTLMHRLSMDWRGFQAEVSLSWKRLLLVF